MIDVEHLKATLDCRDCVQRDLGEPHQRSPRYHVYKCPLHHERKGYSLVVYADRWQCFGKCARGGDVIAWVQAYHGLTFSEACARLNNGQLPTRATPRPVSRPPAIAQPPPLEWQRAARKVMQQAMEHLWGKAGKRAWAYLEQRGLSERTIVNAGLGYVQGGVNEWREMEGLRVPCGITLPWEADGALWGIKVRRAAGEVRYQQVSGGNLSGSLYLADTLRAGVPILLTEGEFDALLAAQLADGALCAASIGSAANRRINPRWFGHLIAAPSLYIRMDADAAGEGAAAQLTGLTAATRRVQVPVGKDVTEFYQRAGTDAVRAWLRGL